MNSIPNPRGIAFFDFDKTILKIDSGVSYGLQIYRDGLTHRLPAYKAAVGGIGYKLGLVRRRTVAEWGVGEYVGLSREKIESWMTDAYPKLIRPHLSKVVVRRIQQHKENGLHTAIISASPPFFLTEAAKDLEMDYIFGSKLHFEEGICTGAYEEKYLGGPTKKAIAAKQAQKLGLTLKDCWFYSDHIADFPLLEAVGNPVAVNPEDKLRKVATEKGWLILEHEV